MKRIRVLLVLTKIKSFYLLLVDALIVAIVPYISLFLRFEGNVDPNYYNLLFKYIPAILFIRLTTFYVFGLYHRLWRYASIDELLAISGAVTLSSAIITVLFYALEVPLPRTVFLLSWFFNIVFVGVSRIFIRVQFHFKNNISANRSKVLIIGAGDAGAMIAREINQRYNASKTIVGFVDDDHSKRNKRIFGIKILGYCSDIKQVAEEHQVDEIIIAIPSAASHILRDIYKECKRTNCDIKTLPGIYELIDGRVRFQDLRQVNFEELLGRDPVKLDLRDIAGYLTGKRVLITGAGGSIGSELCRQVSLLGPLELMLLGKGENSLYEIHLELKSKFPTLATRAIIADVRDKERIDLVFQQYRPEVVFHAAAHKHVPLMELQPEEAVRNNIFGTKVIAEAADRYNTQTFIMISTDKAVNPTSVMGASKRVAELIIQNMSKYSNTKFAAVRFGNVLGSRGSVIPLFKKQIIAGGPITITHPDMQRFFMTIPEATQLVMQAGALAKGGEVFILDMGEPVKIVDLACDLVQMSGLIPFVDIKFEFTGLRPGEKLFEELLTAEEGTSATKHEKIYMAAINEIDERALEQCLHALKQTTSPLEVIRLLKMLVPNYRPAIGGLGDSVEKQQSKLKGIATEITTRAAKDTYMKNRVIKNVSAE